MYSSSVKPQPVTVAFSPIAKLTSGFVRHTGLMYSLNSIGDGNLYNAKDNIVFLITIYKNTILLELPTS